MYAYILADFDKKTIVLDSLARCKAVGSSYQIKTDSYITYASLECDDITRDAIAIAFEASKRKYAGRDFLSRLNSVAEVATLIAHNHALAEGIVLERRREREAREYRQLAKLAREILADMNTL